MDKNDILVPESFLKQPLKDENIIILKWKISRNSGAKKSRFNLVNSIARKMQRKLPKENFIIYLKGVNTSLCHIYNKAEDAWYGVALEDWRKIDKRRHWRKGKRTNKK